MKRWTCWWLTTALHWWKYLNSSSFQISASATGSSCDPVTYVTSVTNARSNTSPSEEVTPPQCPSRKSVKGGRRNTISREGRPSCHMLHNQSLPATVPSNPSREGRNISIFAVTSSRSLLGLNSVFASSFTQFAVIWSPSFLGVVILEHDSHLHLTLSRSPPCILHNQ